MTVILKVMTLFLLMLCGFTAKKTRLLNDSGIGAINTFVLYFAQPCIILFSLQKDASPQLISDLITVFVVTCILMALVGCIAYMLFRKSPHDKRAVYSNLVMASNCGYMGYPVIIAALGEEYLIYAVAFVAAFNLMCWTVGAYFFGGKNAVKPSKLITNPSIIAVLLGIVLLLTGWRLPGFINDAMDFLGNTTTPLALFIIGTKLCNINFNDLKDWRLMLACLFKLVAFPMLVMLLKICSGNLLSQNVVSSLFLCSAMPCAALVAMQAEMYKVDSKLASQGVAISTLLSIVTIPLLLLMI